MRYELRKIIGSIPLCLLFIGVIIINALMFYSDCTDSGKGYTMQQVQVKFQDVQAVKAQQDRLFELIMLYDEPETDEELLTDNIYQERELDSAVIKRAEQAENYDEYRQAIVDESRIKLALGIFGDENSFEGRSLQKGADEYERLSGVSAAVSFFGGVELFADWHISDIFLLVFCVAVPFMLFTYEKGAGLKMLTQHTKNGHGRLFIRKLAACVLLMTAGFALLYGVNFLISASLFGLPDMSAAIQSVYGYAGCSMNISVGEFYALLLGFKYLWALACLMTAVFICSISGSAVVSAVGMAIAAAASFLLGGSSVLWLRNISLSWLASCEKLFQGQVYLNLFGQPIPRLPAAVIFLLAVAVLSFLAGMIMFCRTPSASGVRLKALKPLPSCRHTFLFGYECSKALFMWRGAVILLAFLAVQTVTYKNYEILNTGYELYYRNYSSVLEGEPNTQKDEFIADETARFEELNARLQKYYENHPDGVLAGSGAEEIQTKLQAQQPFEEACSQYENLSEGQSYLYQTPYLKVFGDEARQEMVLNFAKLFFVLAILLFSFFAYEKETGVEILQKTSGRLKTVRLMKIAVIAFYALAAAAIAFVPMYAAVFNGYGGLLLSAQANSINVLSYLPDGLSVGGLLVCAAVLYIVVSGIASAVAAVISEKTKNSVVALVVSLAILLLPAAIAFWLC